MSCCNALRRFVETQHRARNMSKVEFVTNMSKVEFVTSEKVSL